MRMRHQRDILRRLVGWFDKYLLGQTNTAYDVQ